MIKINKLFIPYIIALLILGFKGEIFFCFLMVFFHELVHYITARMLGFYGFSVEVLPIGLNISLKHMEEASAKEDLIISISGPVFNLILAAICYNLELMLLFRTNLVLGLFNFIPCVPLDGGRLLKDILYRKMTFKRASSFTIYISFFIGYFFVFLNIILFYRNTINFSFSLIALFIVLCAYKEKERITYVIMGDIIKKKYKIINRGHIKNNSISIFYKRNLLYMLSLVEKDCYNVFTILNEDLEVIAIIYEKELLDALKKFGDISIEDYLTSDKLNKV